MGKKIFTLCRTSPSGILLYGIRIHDDRKTKKRSRKIMRRWTKRKVNFTGKRRRK
jgi:hypothetical protein